MSFEHRMIGKYTYSLVEGNQEDEVRRSVCEALEMSLVYSKYGLRKRIRYTFLIEMPLNQ
jgi:hypothetical protein